MNAVHVVDDDAEVREVLRDCLQREGHTALTSSSPQEFLTALDRGAPAVAIIDIFFGDNPLDGEALVKHLAENHHATQCIVISGESDVQKTLACLKAGAVDFIEKPVSLARLTTSVRNALAAHLYHEQAQSRCRILGSSRPLREVISRTMKLAKLNETVLIRGESGSGKELIAENLHLWSLRNHNPNIKVNCTALNPNLLESELFGHKSGSFTGADKDHKGLFESARTGTIFIDEIGDFPLALQSKILRVLQERVVTPVGSTDEVPVDVRFIFATHRNLEEMVMAGTFREDLFFRISTFTISVPPLRERLEDIDALAPFFVQQFLANNNLEPVSISPEAIAKLKTYAYPGNIRELATVVKNAAFLSDGDAMKPEHVDFKPLRRDTDFWMTVDKMPLIEALGHFEEKLVRRRFERCGSNVKMTAESLAVQPSNFYRKLKEFGIEY
jgi:DNA-binding NtrC family response regulator